MLMFIYFTCNLHIYIVECLRVYNNNIGPINKRFAVYTVTV